jgi:hypothetical protein
MIYNGEVDVATAGTRVPLASERTPCTWLLVQSKITNTQYVYVGGRTVDSSNGTALVVADSVLFPPVSDLTAYDLSLTFVDADVDGEGVKFTYFRR